MDFYSRSNKPASIACPKCPKIIKTYALQINKDTGKKELTETGKTNTYELIQASKEETMVYNILKRFESGDVEALNKTKGVYGDFTSMPRTLAEAQQLIINTEKQFNELPIEVRREFNMSASEYLASLTNGKFEQIMGKFIKPKEEAPKITEELPKQETQSQGGIKYE